MQGEHHLLNIHSEKPYITEDLNEARGKFTHPLYHNLLIFMQLEDMCNNWRIMEELIFDLDCDRGY